MEQLWGCIQQAGKLSLMFLSPDKISKQDGGRGWRVFWVKTDCTMGPLTRNPGMQIAKPLNKYLYIPWKNKVLNHN